MKSPLTRPALYQENTAIELVDRRNDTDRMRRRRASPSLATSLRDREMLPRLRAQCRIPCLALVFVVLSDVHDLVSCRYIRPSRSRAEFVTKIIGGFEERSQDILGWNALFSRDGRSRMSSLERSWLIPSHVEDF